MPQATRKIAVQPLLAGGIPADAHSSPGRVVGLLPAATKRAGGLVALELMRVRSDVRVGVVMRYRRKCGQLPMDCAGVLILDRQDRFLGTRALTRLTTTPPRTLVRDQTEGHHMPADVNQQPVSHRSVTSAAALGAYDPLLVRIGADGIPHIRPAAALRIGLRRPPECSARKGSIWLAFGLAGLTLTLLVLVLIALAKL